MTDLLNQRVCKNNGCENPLEPNLRSNKLYCCQACKISAANKRSYNFYHNGRDKITPRAKSQKILQDLIRFNGSPTNCNIDRLQKLGFSMGIADEEVISTVTKEGLKKGGAPVIQRKLGIYFYTVDYTKRDVKIWK